MNKEKDVDYFLWKKTKDPKYMNVLLKKYYPVLRKEMPKYKGNISSKTMEAYGKKIMIDSIKSLNPEKGRITTHFVHNLQQLHRINYGASNMARMSEELQMGINLYKQKKEFLQDKFGREPSIDELSRELKWTHSKVARTEKRLRTESLSSVYSVAPVLHESDDPKLDYLYHDLDPIDKVVFQYKTKYRGYPRLSNNEISKKLNISPSAVSIRSKKIASMVQKTFGLV